MIFFHGFYSNPCKKQRKSNYTIAIREWKNVSLNELK
jgi:hypothetical protein